MLSISALITPVLIFTGVLIILTIVGLYLLISGWRGRRVGAEPHCRKCNYILLYLQSARCPECGTEISEQNTVIGEHHRRWGRTVTGISLIVLIGLTCLIAIPRTWRAYKAIDWYRYKTDALVFADLDDPAMFSRAIDELRTRQYFIRQHSKNLSESIHQQLIEKALLERSAATPAPRMQLMEYLEEALLRNQLTPSQRDIYLEQTRFTTLVVRPIVAEGFRVPFYVKDEQHFHLFTRHYTHPPQFWYQRKNIAWRIDGQVVHPKYINDSSSGALGSSHWIAAREPAGPVGKHEIELDIVWTLWHGTPKDEANSKNVGSLARTLKTFYEVLPQDQVETKLPDSPELRDAVRAAITLSFPRNSDGGNGFKLNLTDVPCDIAFDVFFKIDGKETTRRSQVYLGKGRSEGSNAPSFKDLPPTVTVIFRPNAKLAQETMDLGAIYAGEIEFADVPVERD